MHKGQIITLDLIFALTLALAVVFVIDSQWGIMLDNFDNYEQATSAEKAAHQSLYYLTNGRGYPATWNASNVQLIGLAVTLDYMDEHKLYELLKLNNQTLGQKLGAPAYNIHINLTTSVGGNIMATGLSPANPTTVSRAMSFVSYNGTLSRLYVTVWK